MVLCARSTALVGCTSRTCCSQGPVVPTIQVVPSFRMFPGFNSSQAHVVPRLLQVIACCCSGSCSFRFSLFTSSCCCRASAVPKLHAVPKLLDVGSSCSQALVPMMKLLPVSSCPSLAPTVASHQLRRQPKQTVCLDRFCPSLLQELDDAAAAHQSGTGAYGFEEEADRTMMAAQLQSAQSAKAGKGNKVRGSSALADCLRGIGEEGSTREDRVLLCQ